MALSCPDPGSTLVTDLILKKMHYVFKIDNSPATVTGECPEVSLREPRRWVAVAKIQDQPVHSAP